MNTYDRMIAAAAGKLSDALKNAPWGVRVYVWAIPTQGVDKPGSIKVLYDTAPNPENGRIVRPCDNGASTHQTWETVPFSANYGIMWHAMRREPILPIEPSAPYHDVTSETVYGATQTLSFGVRVF